jgi:hypothetical protein
VVDLLVYQDENVLRSAADAISLIALKYALLSAALPPPHSRLPYSHTYMTSSMPALCPNSLLFHSPFPSLTVFLCLWILPSCVPLPPPGACYISADNRAKLGAIEDCVPRLIALCSHNHPDVTRNAAAALGNLAFQSLDNQKLIGDQGGVLALLQLCQIALAREGTIVDMEGAERWRCTLCVYLCALAVCVSV